MVMKECAVCTLKKAVRDIVEFVNDANRKGARSCLRVAFRIEPVLTIHKKFADEFYRCLVCNTITRAENDIEVELPTEDKELLKS